MFIKFILIDGWLKIDRAFMFMSKTEAAAAAQYAQIIISRA
jgi:hypothetical protein